MAAVAEIESVREVIPRLYQKPSEESLIETCLKTSYEYRKKINNNQLVSSLVYGETLLDTLKQVLDLVKPQKGDVFVDIGSGSGKVVLSAALLFEFGKCRGLEVMPPLHEIAQKALQTLQTQFPECQRAHEVSLELADATQTDFSDADVVFMCSTAFDQRLMAKLNRKCESLRDGATVVSLSFPLTSKQFEQEHEICLDMSWGLSTIFIQRKRHTEPSPPSASSMLRLIYRGNASSHATL